MVSQKVLKGLKGLHKTFWGTTKKNENKNLSLFLYSFLKCMRRESVVQFMWRNIVCFLTLHLFFDYACNKLKTIFHVKVLVKCFLSNSCFLDIWLVRNLETIKVFLDARFLCEFFRNVWKRFSSNLKEILSSALVPPVKSSPCVRKGILSF